MNKNAFEIKEQEIKQYYSNANNVIENCDHKIEAKGTVKPSERSYNMSASGSGQAVSLKKFKLKDTITGIDSDNPLSSKIQHGVIAAIHRGIAIASVIGDKFEMGELSRLKEKRKTSSLNSDEASQFHALQESRAAITVNVLASYIIHTVKDLSDKGRREAGELEGISFKDPLVALKSALYELHSNIEKNVDNDNDLISVVLSVCSKIQDEVDQRKGRLVGINDFVNLTYEVKEDSFEVTGFEKIDSFSSSKVDMDFVEPHQVIGNAIAKHQAMRLARMLMCYDFEKKMNPFAELGGHIYTFLGDGNPGTGKTTVIKMMAGLLHKYCEVAGYNFYYENFGPDQISSFQGTSGQNAKQFLKNVSNPNVIGFGTIDDIDQVAGKRGDKQSSAGQQEVTAVLMEGFAGANTRVLGNCTFGLFSNYPENVDDALRQRAGSRFLIDGPQSYEDYVDILALLLGSNHSIPTGDIELFVTQEIKSAVRSGYEKHNNPEEESLKSVFEKTQAEVGTIDSLAKIGKYLKNIQEAEPRFTGRAIKNITDAIKVRSMDFDMPDEWFENPSLFLHKSYEEKLEMIKELRSEITVEMVIQEINRYADSEFRYASKSDDAEIAKIARDMELTARAKEQAQSALAS